jgi:small-conductance mechanosensitive channel
MNPPAQSVATDLQVDLPLPPQHLDSLFLERLLPALVVLFAAAAALAIGRAVALREDEASLAKNQTLRRILRAVLQGLVYVGILCATVLLDRALHGDPQGLDMTLRCGSAVALLWAGFLTLDAFERHLYDRFVRQGRHSAATVIPLLDKVSKAAWAGMVLILLLDNLGLNIKALLAGLGVGGLAVALAGQKTVENLFGGLVLVLDQPVRAGDFCKFGDNTGEVLEVGLRSIKLRTAERTIITVPNGEFSQLVLENYALRDRVKFSSTLCLRLDTEGERLQRILAALEARLVADDHVDQFMPRRARFIQISAYSLDLEVFCYFAGADWEQFMLWRQALLVALLRTLEAEGGKLAFPTQTSISETESPSHV